MIGAAYFVNGYLQRGSSYVVVDYFFDPMCPDCGVINETNGITLETLASTNTITLRYHPQSSLDSASAGTAYSSRAGSALACVAALDEDQLGW